MNLVQTFGMPRSGNHYVRKVLIENFEKIILTDGGSGSHDGAYSYDSGKFIGPLVPFTFNEIKNSLSNNSPVVNHEINWFDNTCLSTDYDIRDLKKQIENKSLRILVITKDPYALLWSNIWHFSETKLPYKLERDYFGLINFCEIFNKNTAVWFSLYNKFDNVCFIRYEDLIFDFNNSLKTIESKLKLKLKNKIINPTTYVAPSRSSEYARVSKKKQVPMKFDNNFYKEKKYINSLKKCTPSDFKNPANIHMYAHNYKFINPTGSDYKAFVPVYVKNIEDRWSDIEEIQKKLKESNKPIKHNFFSIINKHIHWPLFEKLGYKKES